MKKKAIQRRYCLPQEVRATVAADDMARTDAEMERGSWVPGVVFVHRDRVEWCWRHLTVHRRAVISWELEQAPDDTPAPVGAA